MIQDMELLDGGRIAVTALPLSLLDELGATEEDLENITSFLEQLEGVDCAITIRELRRGGCKLSLRSGPALNVSRVCAHLGGGGHPAAAGCSTEGSVSQARDAILTALRQVQSETT
jgi:phosphoesterase RecJ-like protein